MTSLTTTDAEPTEQQQACEANELPSRLVYIVYLFPSYTTSNAQRSRTTYSATTV